MPFGLNIQVMKRRIFQVIDQTESGGAQLIVYYLMRVLRDKYDFSVAVLGKEGHYSELYKSLDIPVYTHARYNRWNPLITLKLMDYFSHEQPELIHTHLYKSNILGILAAKRHGIKSILHDHTGIYPESLKHYSYLFPNRIIQEMFLRIYHIAVNQCDQVLVLTNEMVQGYTNYFAIDEQKITLIPNFVDIKEYSQITEGDQSISLRNELKVPQETKIVAMVGRLEPEKGWFSFLEVARQLENFHTYPLAFIIIGSGSEEEYLSNWVSLNQLNNVHFLGYRHDVPRLLSQSDIFLLTSNREPFGIVILEAMAAGCPVIATRSGGPEYILTDGYDGFLVKVGDNQGMAERIMQLIQDEGLSRMLAKHAKETVVQSYDLDVFVGKMASIYEKVLA